MTHALHLNERFESIVVRSQRIYRIGIYSVLIMIAVGVGAVIKRTEQQRFIDSKTVAVFSEGLARSNSPQLVLDASGVVLKSNTAADKLFAGGQNIEALNVHDFCQTPQGAKTGIDGLGRWYKQSGPDSRLLLKVTAKLPRGTEDLLILATTVPPEPGSTTAVVAIVYPDADVQKNDVTIPIVPVQTGRTP